MSLVSMFSPKPWLVYVDVTTQAAAALSMPTIAAAIATKTSSAVTFGTFRQRRFA